MFQVRVEEGSNSKMSSASFGLYNVDICYQGGSRGACNDYVGDI